MKIGLSMRHSGAPDYQEDRDALARDWPRFLQQSIPGIQWMMLPNLPARDMIAYVSHWDLQGFLLTGGGDPGTDALRDEAENALLDHAVSTGKPVLGVCRGFQMIQQYLGGGLTDCDAEKHVSRIHTVYFTPRMKALFPDVAEVRVNSYHHLGITTAALAPPLKPLAVIDDWVECAFSDQPGLMGMLWHPERVGGNPSLDGDLMERFFTGRMTLEVS